MERGLTIGEAARDTGLSVKAIRFYEETGLIPPPGRTASGYRTFSRSDIRRLRLARRARLLGLRLADVKAFVALAFASECATFGDQLIDVIEKQRAEIDTRIDELRMLREELGDLEDHVRHSQQQVVSGQLVADCEFCPIIDEKGGDSA